jgi:Domain of unknown function (DUF4785)
MRTRPIAVVRRGLRGLAALTALTTLVFAGAASAAAAGNRAVTLLAPESGDLVPRALATNLPPARPDVPREPVSFSWPVAADQALEARPAPPVQRSKEFWLQASAAELRQGVALPTTAPGALVRVNPAPGAGAAQASDHALDPARFELVDERGRVHAGGAGLEQSVTAEQLAAAGSPFPEGTAAFRLRADLGAGRFLLRAPELAASSGRYVIHVLDRASDLELALGSGRTAYLAGDVLTIETELLQGGRRLPVQALQQALQEVTGYLVAPNGEARPVRFQRTLTGAWRASASLTGAAAPGALWEVEVTARGEQAGRTVLRGVRTAFAVAAPTARFTGLVTASGEGVRPAVTLEVEAAAAGRYEARGVLFATDAKGELRPAAVAHAAAWLEPGRGRIDLAFDPATLAEAGLGAPFEVRDLQLLDQGRMGLLHRQARGLVLP